MLDGWLHNGQRWFQKVAGFKKGPTSAFYGSFDFFVATFDTSIAHSGMGGLMDVVGGLQKVVYGKTQQDHDYLYTDKRKCLVLEASLV